jgi:Xaa-Pro aminopeptidase
MNHFAARRDKLRKLLQKSGVETLLVTSFPNVTYLTGFTGDDSHLLFTRTDQILISDTRYTTQIEEECPGLDVHIRAASESMLDAAVNLSKEAKLSRLGIEGDSMLVGYHQRLAQKAQKLELVTTTALVEQLRMIKDKEEVAEIRRAVTIAEKAFAVVRAALRPEQTEKEVADALEHQMRLFGGSGASFPPIVGVGDRSALPHYRPGNQRIVDGDFVLIDWGAIGRLYMSDLTRTLVTGKIPPKLQRIYGVVLKAQMQAIDAIRPGKTCGEIDAVARGIIEKAGFGKQFGHGLGHGLGLQIHEAPRFAVKQTTKLEPGMVMTVEPGIYLPGFGGVRIEDDVLVTRSGCEMLTSVPKQWEESFVAVN